jgi:translation initiation factor IF-3
MFLEVFYIKQDFLVNEQIRFDQIQVISDEGEKLGTMSSKEAINLAEEKGLDLVLVAPNAEPPVCKILDYSKYKFEMAKKEKEARKNQKVVEIKEIRLSPNIDKHDMEVKVKSASKFLAAGDKVKVAMKFRGRELNFIGQGKEIMNGFKEMVEDCQIEKEAKLEGKNLIMFLAPKQK